MVLLIIRNVYARCKWYIADKIEYGKHKYIKHTRRGQTDTRRIYMIPSMRASYTLFLGLLMTITLLNTSSATLTKTEYEYSREYERYFNHYFLYLGEDMCPLLSPVWNIRPSNNQCRISVISPTPTPTPPPPPSKEPENDITRQNTEGFILTYIIQKPSFDTVRNFASLVVQIYGWISYMMLMTFLAIMSFSPIMFVLVLFIGK